ncbi:hypothetical protein R1sor_001197 [Riccia sorocarpa]|uniref:Uncharacterized protein n=1 Tax=Riccia sorocarpa TaxID=122646 RepID=A0ABD3GVA4_9MARC
MELAAGTSGNDSRTNCQSVTMGMTWTNGMRAPSFLPWDASRWPSAVDLGIFLEFHLYIFVKSGIAIAGGRSGASPGQNIDNRRRSASPHSIPQARVQGIGRRTQCGRSVQVNPGCNICGVWRGASGRIGDMEERALGGFKRNVVFTVPGQDDDISGDTSVTTMAVKGCVRLKTDCQSDRMKAAMPAVYEQNYRKDFVEKGLPPAGTRNAFDKAFCKLLYAQQHLRRNVDFNRVQKRQDKWHRSATKVQSEPSVHEGSTSVADFVQYDENVWPLPTRSHLGEGHSSDDRDKAELVFSRAEAEVLRRDLEVARSRLEASIVEAEVLRRKL